ncbi:replication restart DNA helicase PriA [Carnobacterium iners]|uniref:Replication restart protein PriA n=1 Tax=Carnobacterium iners TaxID=1073423 RepID=A0A1X7NJJ6_9LACT|nr:primosomal protein N' [Carnobacterium iners]SEK83662.1 replication restart DNA helicase PriA [Carnobacterium iners]SMH37977.1 replication restart DNA helicase PriA [Carnobacterium iners]
MVSIAKVIVDVPTMQTNKPYDYLILAEFDEQIMPGMRVEVPFGQGARKVQGFVVEITQASNFKGELKAIANLMDLTAVLDEELLLLGREMARWTFSFQITCYQTMLPAMLRAKYEKKIKVIDEIPENLFFELFKGRNELTWDEATERGLMPQLLKLKKKELVELSYSVKNQAKTKKRRMIQSDLSFEQLEEEIIGLGKRAPKQSVLLRQLQSLNNESISTTDMNKKYGVSAAILREAENKKWLSFFEEEMYRDPFKHKEFKKTEPFVLNDTQEKALQPIMKAVKQHEKEVFLLKGVTGSGKTEIYLQTIAETLKNGQSALMLVPEIALTPQMVHSFKGRFGGAVAVLHSGLSIGEKYDEWRKIERQEAKVVVGARSSIFAPVKNIGVIIIDEEHEGTYKQDENPRYHAKDVAIWRADYHSCPVILGSATPSLESRARAYKKVYTLLELPERVNKKDLPVVEVIDMREEVKTGNRSNFSIVLQEKIRDRIAKKEQIVLLLNRRGYSSFVMCRDCGFVLPCPNCDISLTLHMDTKTMKCHYCGHEEAIPRICPSCNGHKIRYYGTGTQKIEEELHDIIPEARVIRMDVDTTRKKGAHEKLLSAFGNKEADILLGTQMIAKGLDFPNITLAGVLNADTGLGLPDFRASERTFQLLTQVSGRAGRAELKGEVIVQTFNPEHYSIQLAQKHDYDAFYQKEMLLRHRGNYPPFFFTILITTSHTEELQASKKMQEIVESIRPNLRPETILLGPTPKAVARVNNRYYYQTIIKYKHEPTLFKQLQELLSQSQKEMAKGLQIAIDSEPMHFI